MRPVIRSTRTTVFAAVAVLIALGTAACAPEPPSRLSATPRPTSAVSSGASASPGTGSSPDASAVLVPCENGTASISGSDTRFRVSESCALVRVAGSRVDVDLRGATIDQLEVNGDANRIASDGLTAVRVQGQRNEISSAKIGSLLVRGDGNAVTLSDALGALDISGSENAVSAVSVGSVAVQGDRNTYPGS